MDPLSIALIISSVVGAVSSITGSAINSASQKKANQTNIDLQKQANEANSAATAATNQTNIDLQREVMAFNSAEAQKQRDWETEMSNTAVTRRMEDLKNAGVNPLLAIGDAASTLGGPSASASATRTEAPRAESTRVSSTMDGSALQSLASFAQSAAFMAALNYGRQNVANTYAKSRAEVAGINSAARTKDWQQYSYKLSDGSWLTQRKY